MSSVDLIDRALLAIDDSLVPAASHALGALTPASLWYRAAFRLSRSLAPVARLRRERAADQQLHDARILNRMLSLLTRSGRPFPIPWRAVGAELLDEPGGVVLCSAHVPLIKVGLRAAMELGHAPTLALAGQPGPDGAIAIWGLAERLPAVRTRHRLVLLRARTVLRSGGCVALLLDAMRGAPLSPNILRLAGRTGARALFFFTELERNGTITVTFRRPPDPLCQSDSGIAANIAVLEAECARILSRRAAV
jgi:hypothetical protein